MQQKKDLTKRLIAESFKELVKRKSFEKLTIKMISDEAGIIRPTFYNYYRDKYDVMEYLMQTEIIDGALEACEKLGVESGVLYIVERLMEDKPYYEKVFLITGQNSFEEVLKEKLVMYIQGYMVEYGGTDKWPDNPALTPYVVASCEASAFISYLKFWLYTRQEATPEEIVSAYSYIRRGVLRK